MEPPVPIPNTVVKHLEAESTCMETCWEDRKLPVIVGVSPSGKAWDFGLPHALVRIQLPQPNNGSLAQLAEHLTFNQGVPSSNLG